MTSPTCFRSSQGNSARLSYKVDAPAGTRSSNDPKNDRVGTVPFLVAYVALSWPV